MSVSIVVGTFGDAKWSVMADAVALPSAYNQTYPATDIISVHADTLAQARNIGAERANGDWLVFLDADDTLDPRYLAAMSEWMADRPMLLQPSTLGVYPDGREDEAPVLIPARPLHSGNFMVIGTAIRRDQFLKVGGFKERPMYEDWCLWIRAWQDGALLQPVPDAIYRVGVNPTGRNSQDKREQERWFRTIRSEYFK